MVNSSWSVTTEKSKLPSTAFLNSISFHSIGSIFHKCACGCMSVYLFDQIRKSTWVIPATYAELNADDAISQHRQGDDGFAWIGTYLIVIQIS